MKTAKYLSCIVLSVTLATAAFAQTTPEKQYPQKSSDKTVNDRLQKDWSKRNAKNLDQTVQWYELGDGYYGNYMNSDSEYVSYYDKKGTYVQSYKKGDWGNVSPTLKSFYDNSEYKNQEVTGYWENSEANKKGYYLELKDDQDKMSRVWVDENGKFSKEMPMTKPKN